MACVTPRHDAVDGGASVELCDPQAWQGHTRRDPMFGRHFKSDLRKRYTFVAGTQPRGGIFVLGTTPRKVWIIGGDSTSRSNELYARRYEEVQEDTEKTASERQQHTCVEKAKQRHHNKSSTGYNGQAVL